MVVAETAATPKALNMSSLAGLLTRPITRLTLNRTFANWQATKFCSSSPVTEMKTSAFVYPRLFLSVQVAPIPFNQQHPTGEFCGQFFDDRLALLYHRHIISLGCQ